jgi:hypothetical protein
MRTTIWSFDVDNVESVPLAVSRALAEATRQNKEIVDGPTIEQNGNRWSLTFLVEGATADS